MNNGDNNKDNQENEEKGRGKTTMKVGNNEEDEQMKKKEQVSEIIYVMEVERRSVDRMQMGLLGSICDCWMRQ